MKHAKDLIGGAPELLKAKVDSAEGIAITPRLEREGANAAIR